ncbi:Conserved_hypothetical protein [Hexamita inflata]|uniref:RING-type domain-containing protein n=1 Tax=Hexamita inflata TaxID=28002 RepID=A0AA86NH89_9EUKA|nr:Conserved hypothetical protein [Hexamita inflata]
MIETYDEIYNAFQQQLTREQYNSLVRCIYYSIYKKQVTDFSLIEDRIIVKIQLIQQLKLNSPTTLLEEDLLPLLNDNLPVDNDSSLFDKYRCSKCKLIMPQAYKADCGCQLCRKCIQKQYYIQDKSCPTCQKPVTNFEQQKDAELFVRNLQFLCPYCKLKQGFKNVTAHLSGCQERIQAFRHANADLVLNQIQDKVKLQNKMTARLDFFLNEGNKYSAFYEAVELLFNRSVSQANLVNLANSETFNKALLSANSTIDEKLKPTFDSIVQQLTIPELDVKDLAESLHALDNDKTPVFKLKRANLILLLKQAIKGSQVKMDLGSFFKSAPQKVALDDSGQKVEELNQKLLKMNAELKNIFATDNLTQISQLIEKERFENELSKCQLEEQVREFKEKVNLNQDDLTIKIQKENEELKSQIMNLNNNAELQQQMQQQIKGLQENVHTLKTQLKFKEDAEEEIKQELDDLKDSLQQKEGFMQQQQHIFEQSNSKFADIEFMYSESQQLVNSQAAELEDLKLDVQKLKQLLDSSNQKVLQLTQSNNSLETTMKTQKVKVDEFQSILDKQTNQIAQSSVQISMLNRYKQCAVSIPKMIQGLVPQKVEEQLQQIQTRLGAKINSINQQFKLVEAQSSYHTTLYKNSLQTMQELKLQNQQLVIKNEDLAGQMTNQQKAQSDSLQRNLNLVNQVSDLKSELSKSNQKMQETIRQKDELQQKIGEQQGIINQMKIDLAQIQQETEEQLKQKENMVQSLEKSLAYEEDDNRQLKYKLKSAEQDITNSKKKVEILTQNDFNMQEKIKQHQCELIFTYKQLVHLEKTPKAGLTEKQKKLLEIYQEALTVEVELEKIREIFNK